MAGRGPSGQQLASGNGRGRRQKPSSRDSNPNPMAEGEGDGRTSPEPTRRGNTTTPAEKRGLGKRRRWPGNSMAVGQTAAQGFIIFFYFPPKKLGTASVNYRGPLVDRCRAQNTCLLTDLPPDLGYSWEKDRSGYFCVDITHTIL